MYDCVFVVYVMFLDIVDTLLMICALGFGAAPFVLVSVFILFCCFPVVMMVFFDCSISVYVVGDCL